MPEVSELRRIQMSFKHPSQSRRKFLQNTVAASSIPLFFGPWKHNRVYASTSDKPFTIGLTHDATGHYGMSGQSDMRGCIMAIEEANAKGGILGRPIEYVWKDTKTDPETGAEVAKSFINENEVSCMVGAVHSSVAAKISEEAQKVGCIYLNTNSSSPKQASEDCHRVKFVFDANAENFALASVQFAVETYGDRWVLLVHDYEWGHRTGEAIRKQAEKFGAKFVKVIPIPEGTTKYINVLRQVRQIRADVVATAIGGTDVIPLRAQAVDVKLHQSPVWLNNQQDWPDHYAASHSNVFGVFGTTWYHKLPLPGVEDFVKRYQARWPDNIITVPGNVFYNGYMAVSELIAAAERAGTTNNLEVIKQLENLKIPAERRMQHTDAYMNPTSHHLQQTVYIATSKSEAESTGKNDIYNILDWVEPSRTQDAGEASCKLESFADTPVYDV